MVAMIVRGYNMGSIRNGWVVYFKDRKSPPHAGLVDELCVVKPKGGDALLRFLKSGRKPGAWDLVSVTGDPILDADLEWAEQVDWIRPHRMGDSDIAMLAGTGEYIG
jgi:hypothetical protein